MDIYKKTKHNVNGLKPSYVPQKGDQILVSLTPLPGNTSAWGAHFQIGRVGIKSDGAYISRSSFLTGEQGRHFLSTCTKHIRSLRPGSSSCYFQIEKLTSLDGKTVGDFDHTGVLAGDFPAPNQLPKSMLMDSFTDLCHWVENLNGDDLSEAENSSFNTADEMGVSVVAQILADCHLEASLAAEEVATWLPELTQNMEEKVKSSLLSLVKNKNPKDETFH